MTLLQRSLNSLITLTICILSLVEHLWTGVVTRFERPSLRVSSGRQPSKVGCWALLGNLSTRCSWYHGRQPEVFLQHDNHCACQDVLELRSRTLKREFSGWNQGFKFWVLEEYLSYKSRNSSSEIMFLNYSVGVRDVFTSFWLMICIWHANRVPFPVLRGQPCRSE